MCQQIRAQWRGQGWGVTSEPTKTTPAPSSQVAPKVLTTSTTTKTNPAYTLVNRPITKTTYIKGPCINGKCTWIPTTQTIDNWVRVPVKTGSAQGLSVGPSGLEPTGASGSAKEESFEGTPAAVVPVMISLLELSKSDRFVDVGCGDGRLVIEAAKAGVSATGIEMVPSIARQARSTINSANVKAEVITADFHSVKLDQFTAVALYQYPDTVAEIVKGLKPGTRVVSYAHEIPGVDCKEVKTSEASVFVGVIPEPDSKGRKPVLFGL